MLTVGLRGGSFSRDAVECGCQKVRDAVGMVPRTRNRKKKIERNGKSAILPRPVSSYFWVEQRYKKGSKNINIYKWILEIYSQNTGKLLSVSCTAEAVRDGGTPVPGIT